MKKIINTKKNRWIIENHASFNFTKLDNINLVNFNN